MSTIESFSPEEQEALPEVNASDPLDALIGQSVTAAMAEVEEISRQLDELQQTEVSEEAQLFANSVRTLAETVGVLVSAINTQATQQPSAPIVETTEGEAAETVKKFAVKLPALRLPNFKSLELHHYMWMVTGVVLLVMAVVGFSTIGGGDKHKPDTTTPTDSVATVEHNAPAGHGTTAEAPAAATHEPAADAHGHS